LSGSVEQYTDRCIVAILSLESQVICWPDEEERQEIKHWVMRESGFQGLSKGPFLFWRISPSWTEEDCFSRKGRYGIAGLVVCDDRKRIRHVYTGWPGCAHDARVFENSILARQPDRFFSGEEYLLADSGYTPSLRIIPAFKKSQGRSLNPDEAEFNSKLSNIRVRVEHCIGILKGRFQSLKGLRTVIRREKDVRRLVYWIRACCVLHNLALQDPVEQEWLEDEEEGGREFPGEGSRSIAIQGESAGKKKRRDLMPIIFSK
jgi:hypothetical protein